MKKLYKMIIIMLCSLLILSNLELKKVYAKTGTSFDDAITIEEDVSYSNSISSSDSECYYVMDLETSGNLTITVDTELEAFRVYIYDENQEQVTFNNSFSFIQSSISYELTSGTYYIVFSDYSYYFGDFSFEVSFTSSNESIKETSEGSNNSFEQASFITLNNTYNGHLGINDTVDYYKFTLEQAGTLTLAVSQDVYQLFGYIYNEGEETLDSFCSYQTSDSEYEYYLSSGTYYFMIKKSGGFGNYSFTIDFDPYTTSFYENGDSFENANSVELDTTYYGYMLADNNEIDYYKFTVDTEGYVTISMSLECKSVSIHLYDENKGSLSYLTKSSDDDSKVKSGTYEYALASGTYYFVVEQYWEYTGNYNFKITLNPFNASFSIDGDSFDNANNVELNTTYYGFMPRNSIETDTDYYQFTTPTAGIVTVSISLESASENYGVFCYLYDENKKSMDNLNSTSSIVYSGETAGYEYSLDSGTYYFVVEQLYTGGSYNFKVSLDSSDESFSGDDNSFDNANTISLNKSYSGCLTKNDTYDYYKFKITSSGEVTLNLWGNNNESYSGSFKIYDESQKCLSNYNDDYSYDLTTGTYYLVFYGTYDYYTYGFDISFKSCNESFAETGIGINNDFDDASDISFNITYIGQLARNDTSDYYTLTLSNAGRITITISSDIGYAYYNIYDSNQDTLQGGNLTVTDSKSIVIDVTKGTYYLKFYSPTSQEYITDSDYTGNYNFKLTYSKANVTIEEDQGGSNNVITKSTKISFNKTYKAQIASNDFTDYYQITLSKKSTITINANSSMLSKINIYIYDAGGYSVSNSSKTDTIYEANVNLTDTLSKGTYYIRITGSDTGNYSFKVSNKLSSASLSTTSYTYNGKAKTPSVTVKNGAGTTLKKGTDYTVSYASGRKSIGSYKVTITGKGEYTGTITKTFKINPKKVTISSAKSSSKKKITVKWKKVSGSVKYKIAYRVKGTSTWKYKYVSSSTYSKTLTGLKSGKTYQVKVRAYKKVSGTTYYGSWSSTKNVKVK